MGNPSTRSVVILVVEYDSLTNPDEVADILAKTTTMYEGVMRTAAKAVTPRRADAVETLIAPGDRAPVFQYRPSKGEPQPMPVPEV